MNIFLMISPISPIKTMTEYSGGSILDMEFNYSPDRAYQVLEDYGAAGRAFYASTFVIVLMIRAYPNRLIALARFAAFSTNIKFVFTIISGVCILVGLIIWMIKRRRT